MSLRGLAVLAVLATVAVLAVVRMERARDGSSPGAEPAPLLDVAIDNASRIEITGPSETFALERRAEGWISSGSVAGEADPGQVQNLLQALRDARVVRVVEENAADLSRFGLNPPERRVLLAIAGQAAAVELRLGRTSPIGWQRYVSKGGGWVGLVDGTFGTALERSAGSYLEMRLLPVETERIRRIEIADPHLRVVLERRADGWWIAAPYSDRADSEYAGRIVRAVGSTRFERLESVPPGGTGPSRRIAIRTGEAEPEIVADLGLAAKDGMRSARRARGPVWGRVSESAASEFEGDPEALRERSLANFLGADVREIAWTLDGASWIVRRDTEGGAWTSRAGAAPGSAVDAAKVERFLDELRRLKLTAVRESKDHSAGRGRVALAGDADQIVSIAFRPVDGGGAWAESSWRPGVAGTLAPAAWKALVETAGAVSP